MLCAALLLFVDVDDDAAAEVAMSSVADRQRIVDVVHYKRRIRFGVGRAPLHSAQRKNKKFLPSKPL